MRSDVQISDPHRLDALERWQSTRPKPGPQPRQQRTAQQINQQRRQEWVSWIDNRIGERLDAHADSYDHAVGEGIAAFTVPKFRTLQSQIRALNAAREKIERLRRGKADIPLRWHVDAKAYTATAFYQDGSPGPTLNLRDLFVRYFEETGGGSGYAATANRRGGHATIISSAARVFDGIPPRQSAGKSRTRENGRYVLFGAQRNS